VEGKNLVGAFHQPALVLADVAMLRSLPEREFRAGMAEVVKYGVIRDAAFFERIERELPLLHPAGDAQRLAEVVGRCCEIKAEVVAADEREGGLRAILNFGHTLGHAIENCAGYGAQYIHGEAISVGMVYAAGLSGVCCGLPISDAERIEALLRELGLPVRAAELEWKRLRCAMDVDKKTVSGVPRFVLADTIGSVSVGHAVGEDQLEAGWNAMI
jgi:3-dehydroquinate synthase